MEKLGEPTVNPIQKKLKEENNNNNKEAKALMKGTRRRSADELLSIANDGEEWKRFYVSLVNIYNIITHTNTSMMYDNIIII